MEKGFLLAKMRRDWAEQKRLKAKNKFFNFFFIKWCLNLEADVLNVNSCKRGSLRLFYDYYLTALSLSLFINSIICFLVQLHALRLISEVFFGFV